MTDQIMDKNISTDILKDYWSFFTTRKGCDMLPYIYTEGGHLYDELIKNCQNYYLFQDELDLIKKNNDILSDYLGDISNLVEIGPGSNYVVENKIFSILNYAKNLKNYYAIDYCENYLSSTKKFIQDNIPNINVKTIAADILDPIDNFQLKNSTNENKAIIMLGSTIGNFYSYEQNIILSKISNNLKSGEMFIITVDTNKCEQSLLKAYDNKYLYNLCNASLKYFAKINSSFLNQIDKLTPKSSWNNRLKYIDIYFIAKEDFSFNFYNDKIITIKRGQELRGIKSKKFEIKNFVQILENNKLLVKEILNNSDKMSMFITQRI